LFGQATETRTRDDVFAAIPADRDRPYPLFADAYMESTAADGTIVLFVIHRAKQFDPGDAVRPDELLRVWTRRGDRYSFLKALAVSGQELAYPSAEIFRFQEKLYLRLIKNYIGNMALFDDELFRVERNSLTPIHRQALPAAITNRSSMDKKPSDSFSDEDLRFSSGIWAPTDPNCCPSTPIDGTYTIVGDELRVATWKETLAK
jgi:hypothetical protein